MTEPNEPDIFEDPFDVLREHDIMKLFDELSFRQKWSRVFKGIKQPSTNGEHKWARLQMIRLLSPVLAVIVPVLLLLLIAFLARFAPTPSQSFQVTRVDPTPMDQLDEIEPPEVDPLEPPDPIDVQMDVATDMPSMPNDVISPPAETASVQPSEFDTVAQVKSPVVLTGIMGSRNPGTRGAALGRYGGSGHTEEAVLRALRWLAKNQHSDGSWGERKAAMTSLAILAYLAHGDTPASEEFGATVEKAIRFLVGAQEANGRFRGRDNHDYTHPIAAYALAEAYGMTKVPMLKEAAIKALRIIVRGQNPSGGFDYNLKPSDRDDTSYMAWCVQALKAAQIAGLDRDVVGLADCMKKAIDGFRKNYGERDGLGGFGYTSASSTHGLSGAGALSMQFLGEARSREVRNTLPQMLKNFPFDWEKPNGRSPVYYWYYNTQAFFQEGGSYWEDWNKQFSLPLAKVQTVIGKDASGYVDHKGRPQAIGFWDSPAERELTGGNGRVMDTILCTLMLEVYYRYLPTFQQIPQEEVERELGDEDDLIIEIVQTRPDIRDLDDVQMLSAAR